VDDVNCAAVADGAVFFCGPLSSAGNRTAPSWTTTWWEKRKGDSLFVERIRAQVETWSENHPWPAAAAVIAVKQRLASLAAIAESVAKMPGAAEDDEADPKNLEIVQIVRRATEAKTAAVTVKCVVAKWVLALLAVIAAAVALPVLFVAKSAAYSVPNSIAAKLLLLADVVASVAW